MYINQRKYAEAINIYEKVFEANHKRYDILQLLLQLYAVQNDQSQMLHTLERMELLDGGNEQISFSKMQIYEQQGKKDKASAELKALIDKHPNDLNYQVMFGNWLLQNDKADEAVKIYRHVLKEEPDNTLAQMSMLDYYRAKDMTAEADILLMQAEVYAHQGNVQQAAELVNQIRSRVVLKDIDASGDMVEKVLHERRLELAFEGQRWFDLCRNGKVEKYMNAVYAKDSGRLAQKRTFDENSYLLPLPQTALDENINLEQNSGY
jgi:predicted Zn-dependent protease